MIVLNNPNSLTGIPDDLYTDDVGISHEVSVQKIKIKRARNRQIFEAQDDLIQLEKNREPVATLLLTLGKAFYFESRIKSGEFKSGNELARLLDIEPGYVAELLRLTLISPRVISLIVNGQQPSHLSLHWLKGRHGAVPTLWSEQESFFGIE